jgi:hypothetical protein
MRNLNKKANNPHSALESCANPFYHHVQEPYRPERISNPQAQTVWREAKRPEGAVCRVV